MEEKRIIIGITHGDINGIGYEVILKTLQDPHIFELCTPVIYGSPKVAAYYRKTLNIENMGLNTINHAHDATGRKIYIINCCSDEVKVELGNSTEMAGQAAFAALKAATHDLSAGLLQAIVTAPINKYTIQSPQFSFPGHTEYLENMFIKDGKALMLMVSDLLKVAVVTGHIPVAKVPATITQELIVEKLTVLNKSLIEDFGIVRPRIAVMGLNPHAGDKGVIGTEEQTIIIPAIQQCIEQGIVCVGPLSADGLFGSGSFRNFDAILAMYHDQGLAPFKTLAMENGVNYTAGLPIIRTSPAHGTAYELAGQNTASESSFRNALFLACDIYRHRQDYREATKNPLKINSMTQGSEII